MIHTNRVCQRASSLLQKYKDKGGRVLDFEYVFDPGSILHLQTRICEKIAEKEKNML